MIVGATPETDKDILGLSSALYRRPSMKRVYYSGYIAVNTYDPRLPALKQPPLVRENRLYQADWLLRFYQFKVEEMPEDLEMKITDSGEEERKARELRRKQEENKARRTRQSEKPRTSPVRTPLQGKNAVPDTDSWLKRKFGSIDSLFD